MRYIFNLTIAIMLFCNISKAQINFNRIACGSNITLHIRQGDTCGYYSNNETKTDNNAKFIFEVYNNTLHIEGGNDKSGVAYITLKELKGMNIGGITRVIFDNTIHGDEFRVEFNGASKASLNLEYNNFSVETSGAVQLEISGKCTEGNLESNGASKINANRCIFYKCNIETSGAAQCSIDSVTNDLKVEASGASKIYLKKIPEVYVATRSGAGRIYEGHNSNDSSLQVETKIIIHDGDSEYGEDVDHDRYYDYRNAGFNWAGLNIGFNSLMNNKNLLKAPDGFDYLETNMGSSIQIGLNIFEKDFKIYRHYVMGMAGAGFHWNNYRFTSPYVLQPYQPTLTAIKDSGTVYSVNKLRVTYFDIPVLLGFNTSENKRKAFHLAAGVVVGVRIGAMVKTVIEDNGEKNRKKTFATYNTDQVRYDFMVRLKYKWANIWASYSLNGLFRKNQGPEVHPVAIGVNLLEF